MSSPPSDKRIGEKLISFILHNANLIIILFIALLAVSLYYIPKIKLETSAEVYFDRKSPSYTHFQEWKNEFGNDQVIIVGFSDDDIFTEDNLALLKKLSDKFEMIKGVADVKSLTTVNDITGYEDYFVVEPFIEEVPDKKEGLEELKKRAVENYLYKKELISEDGKTTALIIELENRPFGEHKYKVDIMENVLNILKEAPKNKKFYITGATAVEYYYNKYEYDDMRTFFPIALGVSVIILFLSFRSILKMVLPLVSVLASIAITMFFLYSLGYSINGITTIIPAIMLTVTLSYGVHFMIEFSQKERMKRKSAQNLTWGAADNISETLKDLSYPCFLTAFTSALGFLSLMTSSIHPIRELGLVVGVGIMIAFVITVTLLPCLTLKFGKTKFFEKVFFSSKEASPELSPERNSLDNLLINLCKFAKKRNALVLIGSLILVVICVIFALNVKIESSIIEQFRKQSFIYKSTKFIEEKLSGYHYLNISLKGNEIDIFKEPNVLRKIEDLQKFASRVPEVNKSVSVVDYIKEMSKSFHNEDDAYYALPDSKNLISQYLLLYGARDLDDYVNSRWDWMTVKVRIAEHSSVKLKEIIDDFRKYIKEHFTYPLEGEVLGWTVMEVESTNTVLSGQLSSLFSSFFQICLLMFLVLKSIVIGFISMVPNVIPILINFAIMGAFGIRLDFATSIIAAIAIGIIVDDTIHFLWTFGEQIKKNTDYEEALRDSFLIKGKAVIISTITLSAGFGVFVFSKFMPLFRMAILVSSLMLIAAVCEFFILPSLLLKFRPKFPGQK